MNPIPTILPALLAASILLAAVPAPAESQQERDARMAWFREARFGMFIHWGVYAVPAGEWQGKKYGGGVEWIQSQAKIPTSVVPAMKIDQKLLVKSLIFLIPCLSAVPIRRPQSCSNGSWAASSKRARLRLDQAHATMPMKTSNATTVTMLRRRLMSMLIDAPVYLRWMPITCR